MQDFNETLKYSEPNQFDQYPLQQKNMKFKQLLNQPYNKNTGQIDENVLARLLPETPPEVIRQFYVDHGRKDDFQSQYEDIEISKIHWAKVGLLAEDICQCSYYQRFSNWYNNVEQRALKLAKEGWSCIDCRSSVVKHWESERTWLTPPIFLRGSVLGSTSQLHLVEGHTRTGLLRGLVDAGVITPSSTHEIWLGSN